MTELKLVGDSASRPFGQAGPRVATSTTRRAARFQSLFETFAVGVPFVLVVAVSIAIVPNFLTSANITNVLSNASFLAIVGYGMTFAIAVRGIDLSVGSAQAIVASITGIAVNGLGLVPGILVGLAAGLAVGLLNGVVVARFGVPAFVATLAAMTALRGVALLITNGTSIYVHDPVFTALAAKSFHGLQLQMVVAVLVGAVAWVVLARTPFGKHVIAVGGRPEAAAEAGIKVNRLLLVVYVISGLTVAIASVLLASQLAVVNGTLGAGLELEVIAVVVLGGTSMAGGKANIVGTAIASILLAMINSSLNLLNVPSYWQYIAIGSLLLLALGLDGVRRIGARRARPVAVEELAA